MRIAVISSRTYPACVPDDKHNLSRYGSEWIAAVLAQELSKSHQIDWYAAAGSSTFDDNPNITFHPLVPDFGQANSELLDTCSYEGLKYTELLKADYIIDHSATAANIEEVKWYHGYDRYCAYRNGFAGFNFPRLPVQDKHYIVPSKQNQDIFKHYGFESQVIYYGIPEFYRPGGIRKHWLYFTERYHLDIKDYFLFLHRPTVDKGVNTIIQLAKDLPTTKFVVAGFTPIQEHVSALMQMKKDARKLENIIFVELPLNYEHHYYERELYRNAKAFMAPFDAKNYWEGFGLSNASAVACGCPLIISDSESTRELWIEGKDCLIGDSYKSFKYIVEYFDSIGTGLKPENKFTVEQYGKEYEKLAVMANMAL